MISIVVHRFYGNSTLLFEVARYNENVLVAEVIY